MFRKRTFTLTFLLLLSLIPISSSCSFQQVTEEDFPTELKCNKQTWRKVKHELKEKNLTNESIYNLSRYGYTCNFTSKHISQLLDIYQSTDNNILRKKLLEVLDPSLLENNEDATTIDKDTAKLIALHKDIARNAELFLSKATIEILRQAEEIDELIDIYEYRNNVELRKSILLSISESFPKENTKAINLFKSVAESNNTTLAPIAFATIIRLESGENGENWQSSAWSDYAAELLELAINRDLYKLSLFNYHELLQLTEQYPNSLFTKGCKEYAFPFGGNYFGGGGVLLREPFKPNKELESLSQFLERYPNHPATDDAMYRIGRVYEYQEDYENSLVWYYKSYRAPDNKTGVAYANERTLLIIDFFDV